MGGWPIRGLREKAGAAGTLIAGTAEVRCLLALLSRVGIKGGPPASWALAATPGEAHGFTLLHHAVLAKNFALTARLLEVGADPGEPAGSGLNSLHMALLTGGELNTLPRAWLRAQRAAMPSLDDAGSGGCRAPAAVAGIAA